MAEGVAVLGAGGHAKVVLGALQALGIEVAGVFDDDPKKKGTRILGFAVDGPFSLFDRSPRRAVLAIGDNAARQRAAAREVPWATIVHPAAWVHDSVKVGEGTVVMAGAVVQPDARIGRHAIINTSASVDHDCRLADFVHVAPGSHLSGNTTLGEGAFLGTGSSTRQGIEVGPWAVVGAGAAVVRSLPGHVLAMGVPARAQPGRKA